MAAKRSAGVLLYRRRGSIEFLLAHPGGPFWARRDEGAWTIPKGEIEAGEEARDCALRELSEELGPVPGLDPESLLGIGSIRQRSGKTVEAWAVEADFDPETLESIPFEMEWPPHSGRQQQFPEVDRAGWFDAAAARAKILPAQAPFIDRVLDHLGVDG